MYELYICEDLVNEGTAFVVLGLFQLVVCFLSLARGSSPGLFYVPLLLDTLGATKTQRSKDPLTRARRATLSGGATLPGPDASQERSDRRPGAGSVGALAPVQAAAWWGSRTVFGSDAVALPSAAKKLFGGEARAPEPVRGRASGLRQSSPRRGHSGPRSGPLGAGVTVRSGRRTERRRKLLARPRSGAQRAGRRPRERPQTRHSLVLESDVVAADVKGKGGKEICEASRPSPRMHSDLRGGSRSKEVACQEGAMRVEPHQELLRELRMT